MNIHEQRREAQRAREEEIKKDRESVKAGIVKCMPILMEDCYKSIRESFSKGSDDIFFCIYKKSTYEDIWDELAYVYIDAHKLILMEVFEEHIKNIDGIQCKITEIKEDRDYYDRDNSISRIYFGLKFID